MASSQTNAVLADGTRTRLLDSAGEVFAERGFQAATVREICARAGVNIALINYHFGDKEKLYSEVLKHSIGSTEPEVRALESGLPPEEAFREAVRATMQRICRPGRPSWHFQLMVHEMAQPTAALSRLIDETMRPIHTRMRALIADLLGASPDDDKTRLCAHSVIAQIVHYVHARHVLEKIWPELDLTPERIEEISTHIADFSLAYLTQKPATRTVKRNIVRSKS
jgi:TetR/AcrR family transcriptional regulator, regulator of cefoperazone and chloramphenicol sensitivity